MHCEVLFLAVCSFIPSWDGVYVCSDPALPFSSEILEELWNIVSTSGSAVLGLSSWRRMKPSRPGVTWAWVLCPAEGVGTGEDGFFTCRRWGRVSVTKVRSFRKRLSDCAALETTEGNGWNLRPSCSYRRLNLQPQWRTCKDCDYWIRKQSLKIWKSWRFMTSCTRRNVTTPAFLWVQHRFSAVAAGEGLKVLSSNASDMAEPELCRGTRRKWEVKS